MPYVWTDEQVADFMDVFREGNTVMHYSFVSVVFETTPEFARSVLPPCFDVPAQPTITLSVGLVRESVCGEMMQGQHSPDEEQIGWVSIKASRNGKEGRYSLSELVSGDLQVSSGREFWGNPKKRANAQIYCDGRTVYAWVERHGQRIIEISATLGDPIAPVEGEHDRYYTIKYDFTPDGQGLASDPILIALNNGADVYDGRSLIDTKVTLRPNGADPVESLELGKMLSAVQYHGGGAYLHESQEPLDGRNIYLPYLLGRLFDGAWSKRGGEENTRTFHQQD